MSELATPEQTVQAQERLKILFESAPDAYYLHDLKGIFLDGNQAAEELTGYLREELIGESFLKLKLLSPSQIPRAAALLAKSALEEDTGPDEFVLNRKAGGQVTVEIRTRPVKISGQRLVLGIARDITRRKRAEEQLLAYQQQLRSLASELSLAEERERRRIAADLHDQIGQTLTMINLKLGALREELTRSDLTGQLEEIRGLIEKASQATRSLTFDLAPPVLYELGLEAGLEWLTEEIHEQYGILIEFEDDGQPKPLDDDVPVCLFRAVRELLINVVKHAHARSVKVSIWREGDEVRIVVEDEGVGFDPSELHAPEGRTRGFGLFNIHERLESLGGHVQLESEQGCGTRVTLVKPLKPREGSQKGACEYQDSSCR